MTNIKGVNSRHTLKAAVTVRIEKELRDEVNAVLEPLRDAGEWDMASLVESTLRALVADQDKTLRFLSRYRAPRTPKGRPKANPSG